MKKRTFKTPVKLLLLFAVFLLGANSSGIAQELFTEAYWDVGELNEEQMIRYEKLMNNYSEEQLYKVNIGSLGELEDNRIDLQIPSEECDQVTFVGKNIEYKSDEDYSWYGIIEAESEGEESSCNRGHLLLMSQMGELFGQVQIDGNFYTIEDLGGKNLIAQQATGGENIQSCGVTDTGGGEKLNEYRKNEAPLINEDSRMACDVDVLVLFTPAANAAINNVFTLAASSVNITNIALGNSGVNAGQLRFNLVATEQIALNEAGMTMNQALNGVRWGTNAQARRNLHDADIVMLFVDRGIMNAGGTAGVAWLGPNDNLAYGVSRVFGANNGFVFSHEVGHIIGAHHETCAAEDAGANCANGGFNHAHTWSYTTGWWWWKKTHRRKTLMFSQGASNSDVIQHYSNPNVNYENRPTGIANDRDNARALRNNACTVANFRVANVPLWAYISGPTEVCQYDAVSLTSTVNGPPGPYTYEWKVNGTGTNWNTTPVAGSGSYLFVSPFPNYNVGDEINVRLQVSAPNNATTFSYHQLDVVDDYANGYACMLRSAPEAEVKQPAELSIFPNPSAGIATLTYKLAQNANTEIRIYNTNGNLIKSIQKGQLISGTYQEQLDVSKMSNAVYVVEVITGKQVEKTSLVVLN